MRRPILGAEPPETRIHEATRETRDLPKSRLSAPQLQQRLRQRRSAAYVARVTKLDAGTHHKDDMALKELIASIAAEFPDLAIEQRPLGLVSRCHLGDPYVVHVCDLSGGILEHYTATRAMPSPFERARALALHPAYVAIEVYSDTLRAISTDGSVSVIDM